MGLRNRGSPNFGNFGTPTLESRTKSHLDVGLVERHIVYYKGEGVASPPIPSHDEFCKSELPMARLSTKSVPTMH
jgi:hypothetical protein